MNDNEKEREKKKVVIFEIEKIINYTEKKIEEREREKRERNNNDKIFIINIQTL